MKVRSRLAMAPTGAVLASLAPGVAAAHAATKPGLSWHFTDATVSAAAKTTLTWKVTHPARNGHVLLQRAYGADHRYRTVITLASTSGKVTRAGTATITAPGHGAHEFRVVVASAAGKVEAVLHHGLWSYADMSWSTLMHDGSTHTAQVGGQPFRFAESFQDSGVGFSATSCRTMTIAGAIADNGTGTAGITVKQNNVVQGTINIPGRGSVHKRTFPIAAGELEIDMHADNEALVNGVFSCYTLDGFPTK